MAEKTKYRKIKIIEFERGWQTLQLLQITLVLAAFLAAINYGVLRWVFLVLMLVLLFFAVRKVRLIRTQGLKMVVEIPETREIFDAPPSVETETPQQPQQQQAGNDNWFEQPYPDPDHELFPEKFEEEHQQPTKA